MPKSCNECKIDLRTDICQAFCEWNAEHPYSIMATDRLPDCPLSEAPEPCEDVSDTNVGKMCEYYDLCRNGRDEKKLREELLSAQPECEDAVSRKAAIDALPYLLDYEGFKGESGYVSKNLVRTMLKGLPPVTPKQPGWIPCSKEPPKKEGRYIVTERNIFGNIEVRFRYWNEDCKLWSSGNQMDEVLAWCEIPEPWEGGQDEAES